ncbi:MAG: type II toxin-antitoxin system HicB family antitoxin, partial [Calditrichaeota bacterium]|nr:type II toxin-antitoxin system HicB family antitoxin [Calditrichota bacterium]
GDRTRRDGYFARCPSLKGCYTQGDTYEEVLVNLKDVVGLVVDDMLECGEEIALSC